MDVMENVDVMDAMDVMDVMEAMFSSSPNEIPKMMDVTDVMDAMAGGGTPHAPAMRTLVERLEVPALARGPTATHRQGREGPNMGHTPGQRRREGRRDSKGALGPAFCASCRLW